MNAPIELAKSIFLNAVEIASDEVRRDYVEAKCGGNAGLRQEVQSLLEHHDCLRGFLEHPAENAAITVDAPVMAERPGTQIGPYKLHQEIGEGGMGVVYMALQKEPVRRKVALKIIKPGMDTREVIARSAAEEQALAMMDHPNIARVFDAGTTDSGRPYFVMELVNGVPITQYCDDNSATTTQRLELFTLVCHAVQHAHQKGIIHRDLKPSNIQVDIFRSPDPNRDGRTITMAEMLDKAKTRIETEFQDDKVLQAKLLGAIAKTYIGLGLVQESSELAQQAYDTLIAQHGPEHLDTLAAMQTLADVRKEDGHMPEALTLNEESLRLRKQVLGPTHPDTLESLISLAGCYHYSGRANEAIRLLDDALPVLRNELGLTHPQTLRAMGALTVSYASAGEIEKSLALGEEALQLTKKALGPEHHSTLAAMHNLAAFYGRAQQRDRSIDLYEETIQLKTRSLGENHPSTLRTMIELSHAYTQYGEREKDIALLERSVQGSRATFGPNDPYTLQRINDLCRQYAQAQRLEDAQRLLDEALQLPFETLDAELHDTHSSVSVLAGAYDAAGQQVRALSLREDQLRLLKAKWGLDHDVTLRAMTALAQAYHERGRMTEASQLFEEALPGRKSRQELETPQTLNLMHDQVLCFFDAGRYQEAVEVCEAVLGSTCTKYGAESITTIQRMATLADCYRMAERHEDALRTATEVWELTQKLAPPDSAHSAQFADLKRRMVADAKLVLGKAFSDAGRVNEALPLLQEAAEQHRRTYGPQQHQFLANTLIDLAIAHARAANVDQAAALMDEVV